jgi:hypothetical protein
MYRMLAHKRGRARVAQNGLKFVVSKSIPSPTQNVGATAKFHFDIDYETWHAALSGQNDNGRQVRADAGSAIATPPLDESNLPDDEAFAA